MCIRIIGNESVEFNMQEPLELQLKDAHEILINYDPSDPKIDSFATQIERMVRNGISCTVNIKVNPNNDLSGMRFERKIESLKRKLDVNEIVKGLSLLHADADRRLCEISQICLGESNE